MKNRFKKVLSLALAGVMSVSMLAGCGKGESKEGVSTNAGKATTKIGVLVAATGANGDAVKEALTNVAMQVAAMNPTYISRNDISADELAKIKDITLESALNDAFTLPKPILNKLLDLGK